MFIFTSAGGQSSSSLHQCTFHPSIGAVIDTALIDMTLIDLPLSDTAVVVDFLFVPLHPDVCIQSVSAADL